MRALLQRLREIRVEVGEQVIGAIGCESDFEEVWLSRDSHLKGVPVASAPNIPLAPPITSPSAKSSEIMETMISARATTA